MKKSRLSKSDIAYLLEIGYLNEDVEQIENALNRCHYSIFNDKTGEEETITAEKARKTLGDMTFLSGLARSAFHYSASREIKRSEYLYVWFDSSAIFS
jgi:hypothetical protein